MKYAVLFYLLVFLWGGSVVYQFKQLCRQQGVDWAAAWLFRLLPFNYRFPVGLNGRKSQHLMKMALLVKGGELLCLVLLLRIFWLTQWVEAVFILVILAAVVLALYYLVSRHNENRDIQSVYPLSEEYGVYEIGLDSSGAVREWIGTTLAELDLRRKELLVLSIVREGKVIIFPKGPEVLLAGDRLLVFGKTSTLPAESLWGKTS